MPGAQVRGDQPPRLRVQRAGDALHEQPLAQLDQLVLAAAGPGAHAGHGEPLEVLLGGDPAQPGEQQLAQVGRGHLQRAQVVAGEGGQRVAVDDRAVEVEERADPRAGRGGRRRRRAAAPSTSHGWLTVSALTADRRPRRAAASSSSMTATRPTTSRSRAAHSCRRRREVLAGPGRPGRGWRPAAARWRTAPATATRARAAGPAAASAGPRRCTRRGTRARRRAARVAGGQPLGHHELRVDEGAQHPVGDQQRRAGTAPSRPSAVSQPGSSRSSSAASCSR